jgi:molybdate transport system ATP-binding protein
MGDLALAMILRAKVQKKFESGFALDVETEFGPGFHVLFGASGSGKTTLLDCVAGLTKPDNGRIVLEERTLFDTLTNVDEPTYRRRVGYVLQGQALFPHLTVRDNICFGLGDKGDQDAIVEAITRSMEIEGLEDRRPAKLSAGQRQRVALARSLVANPHLLLMDEPLAALDANTKSTIIDVLLRWNEERQVPILYVTHDREEAYSLGERLIVMEEGKIIATGDPQQVLTSPARNSVAQLAGFENLLQCEIMSEDPDQGTMSCRVADTEVTVEAPLTRVVSQKVVLGIRAGDILVAAERPLEISARNILLGKIESIERRGVLVRLLVNVKGAMFETHVTPGAQIALRLRGGKNVWLVIKTYSCHLLSA